MPSATTSPRSPTGSRAHEGGAPGGWSSPWLSHTPATLDLLVDNGYRYLLDLRLDDQPVWLRDGESGPLLSIPYNAGDQRLRRR